MVRADGTTGRQVSSTIPPRERPLRASIEHATSVALPYGFAASGLLLGVGGVLADRPLAGACGAVAGVTAGLLERHRSTDLERRAGILRERLRDQRAESEQESSELRRQIRTLQARLWERDLQALGTRELPAATNPPPETATESAG